MSLLQPIYEFNDFQERILKTGCSTCFPTACSSPCLQYIATLGGTCRSNLNATSKQTIRSVSNSCRGSLEWHRRMQQSYISNITAEMLEIGARSHRCTMYNTLSGIILGCRSEAHIP